MLLSTSRLAYRKLNKHELPHISNAVEWERQLFLPHRIEPVVLYCFATGRDGVCFHGCGGQRQWGILRGLDKWGVGPIRNIDRDLHERVHDRLFHNFLAETILRQRDLLGRYYLFVANESKKLR